jgi:hypothetical protein
MNRKIAAIATLVLALGTVGLRGEEPIAAASASWAFHFDLEAFRGTEFYAALEERERPDRERKKLDWARTYLGLDPREDLRSITFYGPDEARENAVMIVRGGFDQQRISAHLAGRASFSETELREHRILTWESDDNRRQPFSEVGALAFHPSGAAVLSRGPGPVANALDLLDGLETGATIPAPPTGRAPFLRAFADLSELQAPWPHAALAQHLEGFIFGMGEAGGEVEARLALLAESPEAARQIEAVLQGIQAFALLRSSDEDTRLPDWLALATIVREEADLHVEIDIPVEALVERLARGLGRQ